MQIYWADNIHLHIKRCDYDGHGCRTVQSGLQCPSGLAIFGDDLYWSDYQERTIFTSAKRPGEACLHTVIMEG